MVASGFGAIDKVSKTGDTMTGNLVFGAGFGAVNMTPSGDTTGATDPVTLQSLITFGASKIIMQYGKYYGNVPVVIQKSGIDIRGGGGATASGNDASLDLGTTWIITSGFTNPNSWNTLVTGAFVVIQKNPGAGTANPDPSSNQVSGVRISDLWIDGHLSPALVDGVACYGAIEAFQMERVGCYKVTGKAFPQYVDPTWSSAAFPDGQHLYSCVAQICHDHAFYGSYVDATLIDCHAQSSNQSGAGYGDGFYFNVGGNNRLISCRSDLNANGFTFDSPRSVGASTFFDTHTMVGCGTQGNNKNGLNVINSSTTGTSNRVPVLMSGCSFDGDGQDSGNGASGNAGYAAIHVEGKNDVYGSAIFILEATEWAASGSPQYAITTSSVGTTPGVPSVIDIQGGFFNPVTGFFNDLAPAKLISCNVRGYAGPEYNGPGVAPLQKLYSAKIDAGSLDIEGAGGVSAGDMIHVVNTASSPGNPPVEIEGTASGDRSIGIRVVGDSNNRYAVYTNGQTQFGPGNAGRDIQLSRAAAGLLNITDSGAGGNAGLRITGGTGQTTNTALYQAYCNQSGDRAYQAQLAGTVDSFSRWYTDSNGRQAWGAGSTVQDVALSRLSQGTLNMTDASAGNSITFKISAGTAQTSTTNLFNAQCNASGDVAIGINVNGDSNNRMRVDSNGLVKWGPGGSATQDCQLQRISGGTLGTVNTDFAIDTVGRGLQIKEGANAKAGTIAFTAGGLGTVATTALTSSSRIQLTTQVPLGTVGFAYVNAMTPGTGFTIKSSSSSDLSVVYWHIIEPAP